MIRHFLILQILLLSVSLGEPVSILGSEGGAADGPSITGRPGELKDDAKGRRLQGALRGRQNNKGGGKNSKRGLGGTLRNEYEHSRRPSIGSTELLSEERREAYLTSNLHYSSNSLSFCRILVWRSA